MFAIGLILFVLGMLAASWTKPGLCEEPSRSHFVSLIVCNAGVALIFLSVVVLTWRALP
jgi:hypothetical protein